MLKIINLSQLSSILLLLMNVAKEDKIGSSASSNSMKLTFIIMFKRSIKANYQTANAKTEDINTKKVDNSVSSSGYLV